MEKKENKIKRLISDRHFQIGVLILILGILVNQMNSWYIKDKYPNLPILNDLLLDNLPYLNIVWFFDLMATVSILFFTYYAYKKDFDRVPFFILLFGISQLVRGIFIGLTPFGSPKIDQGLFQSSMFRAGIYPSGHTGFSFLAFLLARGVYKIIFFVFTMIIMASLIIARGHYSVDIFSAIIFNYAIFEFGNRFFKKYYLKDKSKA